MIITVQMQDKIAHLVARAGRENRRFAQFGVFVNTKTRVSRDDRVHISLQQHAGRISQRVHNEARDRVQSIVKATEYEVGDHQRHDGRDGRI